MTNTNNTNTNDRYFYSKEDNFTICVEKLSLKQARELIKDYVPNDDSTIDILYKDGTMVSLTADSDENTKVKLINIVSVVESNPCTYMAYGKFEVNDSLVVSPDFEEKIDNSIIEVDNWDYDSSDNNNGTNDGNNENTGNNNSGKYHIVKKDNTNKDVITKAIVFLGKINVCSKMSSKAKVFAKTMLTMLKIKMVRLANKTTKKTHKYTCKCVSSVFTEKNVTKLIKLATVFSKCKKICTAYERKFFSVKLFNFVNCYKGKQHINKVAVNSKVTFELAIDIVRKYKEKDNTIGLDIVSLCTILVHSRLNKLTNGTKKSDGTFIDSTYKNDWKKLKSDIVRVQNFERTVKEYNTLFVKEYNKKGKEIIKCTDYLRSLSIRAEIADLHECKGYDIVSSAIVKLLDILHNMPTDSRSTYLTDTFEIVRQRSKFDKNGDLRPAELWKYDSTNYIREISKEISRYINSERAIMVSTDIYDFTDCIDDKGETFRMYKKVTNQLDKLAYADYCYNTDIDSTKNDKMVISEMINTIYTNCKLSSLEKSIFTFYFVKGKTIDYISNVLKRDDSTIKTHVFRIRKKIIESGMFGNIAKNAVFTATHTNISISVYDIHNKLIGVYSSIGVCSKSLGLDKSTVAKRIKKGVEATPYKGYYFRQNVGNSDITEKANVRNFDMSIYK